MIQLLQRIGFPPFKRSRSASSSYQSLRQRRFVYSEPLESRVLLAANTVTDLPGPGYALLAALSRGGDELMAHAGVEKSQTLATPAADPIDTSSNTEELDEPVQTVVTTADAPQVNVSSDTTPEPLNATAEAEPGDIEIQIGKDTFVIYNSINGNVRVESESFVTTVEMISASGIFTREDGNNLDGPFDIDEDDKVFKLLPEGFRNISFGNIAEPELTEEFIREDLTINGSNFFPDPEDPDDFLTGGLSNKQAKLRVQAVSLSGAPINEIGFNEEFLLRVTVEDKRPPGTFPEGSAVGVFAAYMDIEFDPDLVDVVGSIEFSDDYGQVQTGTISDGLIDELGAVATSGTGISQDEVELAVIRMRAQAAGELEFTVTPADILPAHDTLLFGESIPTDPLDIEYQDALAVTVTDTPTAPDLVQFAKDIADSGAVFYGAAWCPHCTDQKELFEDGQVFLPFVEATNPDRTPNQISLDNNITTYPTWVFADGSRLTGTQSLEALSDATGIAIPESNSPHITPIEDTTLLSGSPLHLPIDGYDPNGGRLTYTITSDNPDLVSPLLVDEGRSAEVDVQGYGSMVFHLFEQRATRATDQIITLAEEDFYDGLIFHRVIDDFVIQGGDPRGDGTGSSDLPDFDDQFHVDLQHNRTGLLSMAKSADDTNNSQFFITEGTSRHLDFNHSIFGVMIEGESNRAAISDTAVNNSTPLFPIAMETVNIFTDTENGLMMLKANEGATGSANITVTVTDEEGHTFEETFAVNVEADPRNGGPFLDDIPDLTTEVNTPVQYQLTAQDVEGDDVTFSTNGAVNATVDVDPDTGMMTITPDTDFYGTAQVSVRVEAADGSDTSDRYDSQVIEIRVAPNAPTVDLTAASDGGASDADDVTNVTELQFEVSNVVDGALVELFADGDKIGEGTASGNSVIITSSNLSALGDDVYEITASQTIDEETSDLSSVLTVELDQTDPGNFSSTPPTSGMVGEAIDYDADHPDEGETGFAYSLANAPAGATIDPDTGEFAWTPASNQAGNVTFDIVATDLAGNSSAQTVSIDVMQTELIRYRLQAASLNGEAITSLATGQSFFLQVFVEDIRDDVPATGVRAAYLDIIYDSSAVQVDGDIQYSLIFDANRAGDTSPDGIIDDAGASTAGSLGPGQFLLMTIPMTAIGSGVTNFGGDAAEGQETRLVGIDDALTASQVVVDGDSLNLVSETFATDDEFDINEDVSNVALDVLNNDIPVPASRTLTIVDASGTSNGTVSIRDGVEIVYTPNSNFFGQDSFTYMIRDDAGDESTATVTVNVAPVNDAPTADGDSYTVPEDSVDFEMLVLDNDSITPDTGETLTITEITAGPSNGSVTNDGGRLLYTPDANFIGTDSFTYRISDGNGGTAEATVDIDVTDANDDPIPGNFSRQMDEDSTLNIDVSELLAGASPGAGEQGQTLTVTGVSGASNGSVVLNGTTVTVTPAADFSGTLTFNYTLTDDGTTNGVSDPKSAEGVATITVNGVNDDPTANDDVENAQAAIGAILIDVLDNDSSAPDSGETLTIIDVSDGSDGGTISIVSGGIEYEPADGFSGVETFTYTISDGNGGEDTATVSVTVSNIVPGGVTGNLLYNTSSAFAGVPVKLARVGATDPFEVVALTDNFGRFNFDSVSPGSYQLVAPSMTFTNFADTNGAGEEMIEFELTAEGLSNEINFAERELSPRFSIWDALASSSDDGFYSSVNAASGHEWSRVDDGWDDAQIVDVAFSGDESELTITIVEDGVEKVSTVSRTDHARIQVVGREDDSRLVRIKGARSAFDFALKEAAEAEGEDARDQVFALGSW